MPAATAFEKQTRDAVTAELAREGGKAIVIIGQHLAMAARSEKDPRAGVVDAVRGGMTALFTANKDLPSESIKLLKSLSNLSLMTKIGPEEVMTWVMEGIAATALLAGGSVEGDTRTLIEEEFHGVGEVFGKICDRQRAKL